MPKSKEESNVNNADLEKEGLLRLEKKGE